MKIMPKLIGLTGGIGSGKTTAAKIIEEAGFPVYYSDIRAKNIVNENAELKQKIISAFGTEAYDENGCYNRKWIAEQVFCNDEKLSLLNSLIHPAVKEDFEKWLAQQNTKTAFKETALLFELRLNEECWKTILITAEENQRIKRVMDRDGRTYRQVKEIIDKQMPETEKIKLADFIIINNGNLENLTTEIREVLAKIETL